MTFTRLSDDEILTPIIVFEPFEYDRDARTVVRAVLESTEDRYTFFPASKRAGVFNCLFATHAAARDAADFFAELSEYQYDGPVIVDGDLIVDGDGYVVEVGESVDTSFSTVFIVAGGAMRIRMNGYKWELAVPYREVSTP